MNRSSKWRWHRNCNRDHKGASRFLPFQEAFLFKKIYTNKQNRGFIMSGSEIIVIVLVFLLLFGSKAIPDVARTLGKGMQEFKKATGEIKREIDLSTSEIKKDLNSVSNDIKKEADDIIGQVDDQYID